MKPHLNLVRVSLLSAACVLALGACKKIEDKPAADAGKTAAASKDEAAKGPAIAGLPTEKDKVSYIIGLDLAKSLQPIKDEVDMDVVSKAVKTVLSGGKPLIDEKQASEIREAFAQRMQAKQIADMMAKAKKNEADAAKFFAENGKKPGVVTTGSGLQYQAMTTGTGAKPKATDVVKVHYTGTLLDGTKFDSSVDRGEPAMIPLAQVVPGWREGIQLMPIGSKFRLWIPSKLGYGQEGTPGGPIPPNAALVFDVELIDIAKPGDMPKAPKAG